MLPSAPRPLVSEFWVVNEQTFGLVLWLRGLSIREYLATRDPVSGTIYYVMVFGSPVCQLCARF